MKRFIPILILLTFFPLFADEVRVEPLEYWQNASQWADRLSVEQFIESSLAASGLADGELVQYTDRLSTLVEDFQRDFLPGIAGKSDSEQGEAILTWMHEQVLSGRYRTDQTLMDVLMDRGDYNCVSSAVLYLILTRAAGLDTAGEETTDHAFCTLRLSPDRSVDIETTTLLGFDPGTKKEFSQHFSGRTGFAYVKPGDYARRQPASDKEMISLILQNRIALQQRRGDYAGAMGPAADRWMFLPDDRNRKDMNDAFRNYVSLLNGRGEFVKALDFLVPLSQELGLEGENRDLVAVLILNQAIGLTNSNRLDEAESFLSEWSDWLNPDQLAEQNVRINDSRAQDAVETLSYEEALGVIRSMRDGKTLSRSRADELITFLHQNRAIELANDGSKERDAAFLDALAFLDSLPEGEKNLPGIVDHRNKYRQNWAVVIHNRWATFMNRGEYDKAEELLNNALAVDGSNPTILKDRDFLEKHRS